MVEKKRNLDDSELSNISGAGGFSEPVDSKTPPQPVGSGLKPIGGGGDSSGTPGNQQTPTGGNEDFGLD